MEITLPDGDLQGLLDNPLVRGLLECSSDGAVVIDARTRRVLAINQRARELLGRGPDAGTGCGCRELLDSPSCALACPLTRASEGLPNDDVIALFYRRLDDELVHANTRMLVVRGPDGVPIAGIELIQDQRDVRALERALRTRRSLHGLVGRSSRMQAVYDRIEELGPCDTPVLVLGAEGSGKRRAAEALHAVSQRGHLPLEVLTEAAVASPRLADILGRTLARAQDGTVVLCRVDAADADALVHLARLLTWGSTRWGDRELSLQGARLVLTARSDDDLPRTLKNALRGATLRVPSLAERLDDLPLLTAALLRRVAADTSDEAPAVTAEAPAVTAEAMAALARRAWPGNVRQLAATVRAAAVRACAGPIEPAHLDGGPTDHDTASLLTLAEAEAQAIDRAMAATDGNVSAAARLLGIDRSTLWRKLKRAGA